MNLQKLSPFLLLLILNLSCTPKYEFFFPDETILNRFIYEDVLSGEEIELSTKVGYKPKLLNVNKNDERHLPIISYYSYSFKDSVMYWHLGYHKGRLLSLGNPIEDSVFFNSFFGYEIERGNYMSSDYFTYQKLFFGDSNHFLEIEYVSGIGFVEIKILPSKRYKNYSLSLENYRWGKNCR